MRYCPKNCQKYMLVNNNKVYILDYKKGDVNGDGIIDYIYLIGTPYEKGSSYMTNIKLKIIDGRTFCETTIDLNENQGYSPTLFLGDFTKDKIDDIYISIFTGGSGGYTFYYIYSFTNNQPKLIFDSEKFYKAYKYEVNYKDDYKVEVISKNTNNTKYILDITYKGKSYLSEIYYDNGKLIKPIEGWVNPLGGLSPIDFQQDGAYDLYAQQRIAGRYNADSLGNVQTSLKWNGKQFQYFDQTIGIYGKEMND